MDAVDMTGDFGPKFPPSAPVPNLSELFALAQPR